MPDTIRRRDRRDTRKDKPDATVPSAFEKALAKAQSYENDWIRCVELARVARFAPESDVARVAEQALKAALLGKNAYRRAVGMARPLRALAERDKISQAQRMLDLALNEAESLEHPVSRMDALAMLSAASWPLPLPIRQSVTSRLLSACQAANSWKAGRIMRDVALAVASEDKTRAQQIINAMRDSVYKRQAQRRLDAGQTESVRSFFPKRYDRNH